ncbi:MULTISPECIES: hypothetical protein [Alicyclobacillus]|uniref:Uncharacterized protein n=1 Tax=Alicyclobacillus acidoterrestris (strain ATCC 49025 / DSM 3922 / CIP 106132 / NCIMB 13137 / GD3B) TaxID=1356854 RepID=A0A9E6ZHX5_ALIAG|nr:MULTISPECIES: hypothetical protein [Alicyclobacillus]UNO51045.1 hypothetical protein K1I37_20940 [Alicyclobacillus acidoterrestris]GEO28014.1 hypothetical protein AAC03nite_37990 [Alicyclobacillus acidoterrestris]
MRYITSTKSKTSANRTKRFLEVHGIPCMIRKNKSTYVLFTPDEYVRRAKQLRHA